jgi:hypothetical protein
MLTKQLRELERQAEVLEQNQFVETLEISHSKWTKVKSDYRKWWNEGKDKEFDDDYCHHVVSSEHLTRASSFLLDNHEKYKIPLFYKLRARGKNYIMELNYACMFSKNRDKVYSHLKK